MSDDEGRLDEGGGRRVKSRGEREGRIIEVQMPEGG